MFDFKKVSLDGDRVHQYTITSDANPLRYSEVLQLLQNDESFRSFFISLLRDSPFTAYRWETPPVNSTMITRPFEFVLINSATLARKPDSNTYAAYFNDDGPDEGVVKFPSLGKDSLLIVPSPRGPEEAYGHLAAFMRQAPDAQVHSLWQVVGETVEQQLSEKPLSKKPLSKKPLWLSTAGGGVSWLHVRLDSRPKYYGFEPYKDSTYNKD